MDRYAERRHARASQQGCDNTRSLSGWVPRGGWNLQQASQPVEPLTSGMNQSRFIGALDILSVVVVVVVVVGG